MKLGFYLKALIIALFISGLVPRAVGAQTIELGYIEFPPIFSTNSAGKPEGVLIDLASKVIPKAGYKWRATSYPTKRMAEYIANGKLHLWIGLKALPEFKGTTIVGDSVVVKITLQAYTVGEKASILKKEDLKGKSIIIMRGYSYGGWVNFIKDPASNVNFIQAASHVAAFKMLKAKRADYLLDYRLPSEKALEEVTIPNLKFNTIIAIPAYFVVSKKTPNAEEVLERMEAAYKQLKKEGRF